MWCIPPEANAEFVCNMENVLETYHEPYDRNVLDACSERDAGQRSCDAQEIEGELDQRHDGERRYLDHRVEIRRRDKLVKAPAFPSDTFHRRASNEEPLQTLHRQVRHFSFAESHAPSTQGHTSSIPVEVRKS